MTKDLVQWIYEELLVIGSCRSRSEFSTKWLGMEDGYYRSIQARGATISVRAQTHLTAKLRNLGMMLARSQYDFVVAKGHIMIDLHSRCLEDLFERVTSE